MSEKLNFFEMIEILKENRRDFPIPIGCHLVLSANDYIQYLKNYVKKDFNKIKMIDKNGIINFKESGLIVPLDYKNDFLGEKEQFISFSSKEELLEYLKNPSEYIKNVKYTHDKILGNPTLPTYEERYKNNFSQLQEFATKEFDKLSLKEQASLVVYKSSLFSIMNNLWQRFGNAKDVDLAEIFTICATDYSKLFKEGSLFETEIEKQKRIAYNSKIGEQYSLQKTIKDRYSYFSKALKNPENKEFFDTYFQDFDFSSLSGFIQGIIKSMKTMELIEGIKVPENMTLYRGICGIATPNSVSRSIMISCTPDFTIANDFAINKSPFGYYSDCSHSIVKLDIAKGTPILPLMFSVKSTFKTLDAEDLMIGNLKWEDLRDDEIKMSREDCAQPEVVLNATKCFVPEITKDTQRISREHLYYNYYRGSGKGFITCGEEPRKYSSEYADWKEMQDEISNADSKIDDEIRELYLCPLVTAQVDKVVSYFEVPVKGFEQVKDDNLTNDEENAQ